MFLVKLLALGSWQYVQAASLSIAHISNTLGRDKGYRNF